MIDNKEVYKITIDPSYSEDGQELGIEQVAFTSKPAVIVKGMAFNLQEPKDMKFVDEKKYRIVAPAMIPMDIYRKDEGGEYYVQFTEQEIENIFVKFMRDLNNRNLFNLEHNQDITVPAYILEAWIVDNPELDKSFTTYGIEVPKGTLMLTSQITDKTYYNKLVQSGQTGFSIEGFMGLKLSEISENKIKTNMELLSPENEGKMFIVKDGKFEAVEETKEEVTEVTEELVLGGMKDEEMEINVEPNAELAPNPSTEEVRMAIDETELMTILQPKFDEIYGLIADLKSALDSEVDEEIQEEVELKLTVHQKFAQVAEFLKK
jgi:hypothetical protein